jgi:cell division protein FtsB
MARVVQRRSNPTVVYVLVAFVILFLISTVVATLQYMEADELYKQVQRQQDRLDQLASSNDLDDEQVQAMMKGDETVVETLTDRIENLTTWILVDASYQTAMQEWGKLRDTDIELKKDDPDALTAGEGLIPLVRDLREAMEKTAEAEEGLAVKLQNCREELRDANSTIESLKSRHANAISELREDLSKQNELLAQREEAHKEALRKAREESQAIQKELRARIEELGTQIDDLQIAINLKNQKINDLEIQIQKLTGGGDEEGTATVKAEADGKVVKVIEADDVCYINIGSRDGVKTGMPFSVYSKKGVTKDGEGKARIVVRNTDKFSSECQIISQEKGKPVLSGDVVSNLAFSSMTPPTFVVRGEFDLFGEGTPTPQNTRIVKNLIKRFGGKVSDELSVQTDYLVLGSEPTRPTKPEEGTQDQGEYQRKLKEYLRFQNLKDEARRLGIPVLNTSRFLAYTGYKPQKTLKY